MARTGPVECILRGMPGLARYRWYRKAVGGRWELWYTDFPLVGEIWYEILEPWGGRPSPLCRGGGPIATEDYAGFNEIRMMERAAMDKDLMRRGEYSSRGPYKAIRRILASGSDELVADFIERNHRALVAALRDNCREEEKHDDVD
jgi:hypothetical protein